MVDLDINTVCCMCGDVGFPVKLFQCTRCTYRVQHSYCSNYYADAQSLSAPALCDWCRSEEYQYRSGGAPPAINSVPRRSDSKLSAKKQAAHAVSSAPQPQYRYYPCRGASDGDQQAAAVKSPRSSGGGGSGIRSAHMSSSSATSSSSAAASKPVVRRYKLLKDVLC